MTITPEVQPQVVGSQAGRHPRGLVTLFFTELWERFSYYGMRAILVLYMVAPAAQGGLGFDTKHAASIYGTYTMSVYLTALPGGMLADRWLGARLAVLLGGIIIACGHFSMVFHSLAFFYLGMVLIAIGTGLLKPNISAMLGGLYGKDDPRRDSGFSIFYMGINIGAFCAPFVCGYLAQGESFKRFVATMGFDVSTSWHWGFGAAGVGMCLGLVIFLINRKRLPDIDRTAMDAPAEPAGTNESDPVATATTDSVPGRSHPLVAVLLSLIIPGTGHMYRGQMGAGLSWLFAYLLAWVWYFAGGGIVLAVIAVGIGIASAVSAARRPKATAQLSSAEWKRVGAIFVFFLFTILFWAAYEQKGASLNLLAKDLVRTEVFGIAFPSSFLQSFTPAFVIILAPIFSYLWLRLGERQPSSPVKFTLGLLSIGLAYCLLVPAVWMTSHGRISWLLAGRPLLSRSGRRDVSESGWIKHGDEAFAGEAGGNHDGGLVPGRVFRQQTGRLSLGILCSTSRSAGKTLRWRCGRSINFRRPAGGVNAASQAVNGYGKLTTATTYLGRGTSCRAHTYQSRERSDRPQRQPGRLPHGRIIQSRERVATGHRRNLFFSGRGTACRAPT